MSALPGPAYHFRSQAQWARVARSGLPETLCLDPRNGIDAGTVGGCPIVALALSPAGRIYRLDARGVLSIDGAEGPLIGTASRLIAGRQRLWALIGCDKGDRSRLIQIDGETLHILLDIAADGVTDIAPDGRDGLWLLEGRSVRRITDSGGILGERHDLDRPARQIAAAEERVALLSRGGLRLTLLDPATGATLALDLRALAGAEWVGKSAKLHSAGSSFLIAGMRGDGPRFLLIGTGGDLLATGSWRGNVAPVLLAASGNDLAGLFESDGSRRILRFADMLGSGSERRLTPALETREPGDTWLRAEVRARLPERATLRLRWAASGDGDLRHYVGLAVADSTQPMSRRLDRVDALLADHWSPGFTYVGKRHDGEVPLEYFAFPLHAAKGQLLWADIQIRRNNADAEPAIESLVVLHDGVSLMDDLPAIYRGDGDRDGTMRRLVGVLEATTQDIDREIGTLADRLDPERSGAEWLPDLAAMLGLPFHEALPEPMQRALLNAAPAILPQRGTRGGLLALFAALFPGRPVRVIDRTEQLVPLTLGPGLGRRLPALLSGPSIRVPKLNARLVLAKTALCPATACTDAAIAPMPQVLVVAPVTGAERRRYADAVTAMAGEMIPAGVRLRINWTHWRARTGAVPDDVLTMIDVPDPVSLGSGPGLGAGRTTGRRSGRIDGDGVTPAEHRLL
jgi:phage tail-like protein